MGELVEYSRHPFSSHGCIIDWNGVNDAPILTNRPRVFVRRSVVLDYDLDRLVARPDDRVDDIFWTIR